MTARILVDSNVLLDVIKSDPVWGDWSADALTTHLDRGALVINPIVYCEVASISTHATPGATGRTSPVWR